MTANDLRDVELLDTSTAAARLDLSPSRVTQLQREGRIPALRTVSGRRIFLADDVERLREQRAALA